MDIQSSNFIEVTREDGRVEMCDIGRIRAGVMVHYPTHKAQCYMIIRNRFESDYRSMIGNSFAVSRDEYKRVTKILKEFEERMGANG